MLGIKYKDLKKKEKGIDNDKNNVMSMFLKSSTAPWLKRGIAIW